MKSKLLTMFVLCTTFFGFTSVQLEAVSALPNMFVVALTREAVNTIVLSTNTLGMILSATIDSTTGTDTQFIGYIEYNATENTTPYNQVIALTQLEAPVPTLNEFYALYQGYDSAELTPLQVLEVRSNVVVTSTPNNPAYQEPQALNYVLGSADITAAATAAYTNFIGVLAIYAVDSSDNYTGPGTFIANFSVVFSS